MKSEDAHPLTSSVTGTTTYDDEYDDFESLPPTVSPFTHMTAGAMAGIVEHTAMYPVDSIKTRMQVLRPHPTAVYTGILHAFRRISHQEGLVRLWRGVGSVIIGAGPAHAIYFATYEQGKRLLLAGEAARSPLTVGLAGALATATSDAFMTPFDVIKQRLQVHGSQHRSILACARSILRTEGLTGFMVSYPTTLLLNVPFHMIQFPVYEMTRFLLTRSRDLGLDIGKNVTATARNGASSTAPDPVYSPLTHVLAGGLAGGTAAFCTTPIDVIKTTLQTRNLLGGRALSGMREAIQVILAEHGPRGFLRGALPRTLTFIPGTGLCWMVYEYFKWVLI